MDAEQPVDLEEGLAGPLGLDRGADPLEPLQQPVPALGDADRVGWEQPQRGTAGERLPECHPRLDAIGLGGGRTSPTACRPPGRGASATGSSSRSGPEATRSEKRGMRTQAIIRTYVRV